ARLPLHPRVGTILLGAAQEGCLREALVVASYLSIDDPRERPLAAREAATAAHALFRHERSDFLGSLALWAFYQEQKKTASTRALRRLCRERYLSYTRMSEWLDVHRQLCAIAGEMGLPVNEQPAAYSQLHRALLTGYLTRVGVRTEQNDYLGPRRMRFLISPASGVGRSGARWVMAAELLETSRLYAAEVARIRPEWIERAAQHLVKRHHREPHWEPNSQKVMAYEHVTFYGLTIVANRRTDYGRIDPGVARELFIREALVARRYHTKGAFFSHNQALLEELRRLEHKARRLDLVEEEEFVFRFYDKRIPADICTGPAFERWRDEAEKQHPELLFLTRESLLRPAAHEVTEEAFPDVLELNGQRFPLQYHFQPGNPDDGITVTIPIASLRQQIPESFEWLVPGRLAEKICFLIRALPKDLRRALGPVSNACKISAARLVPQSQPLTQALTRVIREHIGVDVPAEAWNDERLPEHLLMNFRIVDIDGSLLDSGRNLPRLQQKLSGYARMQFGSLTCPEFERTGITRWDFGDLPEQIEWGHGTGVCRGYPALSDERSSVAIRIADARQEADRTHRAGLRRLFMLELAPAFRDLTRNLRGSRGVWLNYPSVPPSPFRSTASCRAPAVSQSLWGSLQEDLIGLVVDEVLLDREPMIRTELQFRQRKEERAPRLMAVAQEVNDLVGEILQAYSDILKARAHSGGRCGGGLVRYQHSARVPDLPRVSSRHRVKPAAALPAIFECARHSC
nr:DUF3418 domain-containing protein [Gammaproteobacteria bacterium]